MRKLGILLLLFEVCKLACGSFSCLTHTRFDVVSRRAYFAIIAFISHSSPAHPRAADPAVRVLSHLRIAPHRGTTCYCHYPSTHPLRLAETTHGQHSTVSKQLHQTASRSHGDLELRLTNGIHTRRMRHGRIQYRGTAQYVLFSLGHVISLHDANVKYC